MGSLSDSEYAICAPHAKMGSTLCTYGSGGLLTSVYMPRDVSELFALNCKLGGGDYYLLGCGSNTLIADEGHSGAVVSTRLLDTVNVVGDCIYCLAGARLQRVLSVAREVGLSGLEWAVGIPATVGGALAMNAGAYGGDMSQVTLYTEVIHNARVVTLMRDECHFSYRNSVIRQQGMTVVAAVFQLQQTSTEHVAGEMKRILGLRRAAQPTEPSCGSVFLRQDGVSVSPMLTALGMGGFAVGGAQISTRHNGFIVNTGQGTTADYLQLALCMQTRVYEKYGRLFYTELSYIGEQNENFRRLSLPHKL